LEAVQTVLYVKQQKAESSSGERTFFMCWKKEIFFEHALNAIDLLCSMMWMLFYVLLGEGETGG
jgi:hypothetical protein